MNKKIYLAAFLVCFSMGYPMLSQAGILFSESFDDTNLAARGWYDFSTVQLSTAEHVSGSTSSIEYRFNQGATTPASGKILRKKFTETDSVYISYHVKYSSNWEGSNRPYHPHEFYLLTNLEDDYAGPAYTHMTAYVEQNEGTPSLSIQDGINVDESKIGIDLTNVTEARAIAGCNGDSDGYGVGECYASLDVPNGSVHWNRKKWRTEKIFFQDSAGPYYKSDWHFVEAYFKLNSIQNGKGTADGQIKYWFDGVLIIDHENVMLRTGQYPNMKFNQLMIGPYIGDGSPVSQTFWVDNLTLSTARSTPAATDTTPPTVTSTNPTKNQTGVAVNGSISATFSETVAPATITTSSFTVGGVTGTVSVTGNIATFTPSANLAYNTSYTATVTTTVTDIAQNHLAANYTWTFTTAAPSSGSGGGSIDLTNASSGGGCSVAGRTGSGGSKVDLLLILAGLGMEVWRGRIQRKRN
jgi:hypothetical protein